MKKIKLCNKYYEDEILYRRLNIEIKDGLTVLVGCNGCGKTTALLQIKDYLKENNIPFLYHSNLDDSAKDKRGEAAFYGNFDFLATLLCSSEGENIVNVMGTVAKKIGNVSRSDSKEMWILLDAIDSGLSIDNIIELKDFFNLVMEDNSGKEVYILVSANEYELCCGENCLDIANGKYINFKDYNDYKNFIINSRKKKDKRYSNK